MYTHTTHTQIQIQTCSKMDYISLRHIALHFTALHFTALHRIALHYIAYMWDAYIYTFSINIYIYVPHGDPEYDVNTLGQLRVNRFEP